MSIVLYHGRMDISHGYFTNLRAGGNRVRKKEKWNPWLRAAWNIIYKMSYFSSTEFPLLHLSSFFSYKATFESAVLTTKTMNASTCQGSTRLHVCVMSHSPSSTGGDEKSGKMRFWCDDKRKRRREWSGRPNSLTHLRISVLPLIFFATPLSSSFYARFMYRLIGSGDCSSHFLSWASISACHTRASE